MTSDRELPSQLQVFVSRAPDAAVGPHFSVSGPLTILPLQAQPKSFIANGYRGCYGEVSPSSLWCCREARTTVTTWASVRSFGTLG